MPAGDVVQAHWNAGVAATAACIEMSLSCGRRKSFPFELSRNKKLPRLSRLAMSKNDNMPDTLAEPVAVDASEPNIAVMLMPHRLLPNVLDTLAMAAKPAGRTSDCLRQWLGQCVACESARRLANVNDWGEPLEPPAWHLPWHSWTDDELSAALACSYSWLGMRLTAKERAAFDAVHRAIVTACCTRLGELHSAIEAANQRRAAEFAEA
jgi:hypothetical protein